MARTTIDREEDERLADATQKAVPVRIEPRTYIALAELAQRNRRSITAEINDILANHVTVQEAWPD